MQRPLPIEADMFLYAAGRNGNNADLACDKAGLHPDERETLKVDEIYRSAVPHICAAGDVIGFPALGESRRGGDLREASPKLRGRGK